MSQRLPEYIDPLRLAEKNRRLAGRIALARMKRLASSLSDSQGEVELDLQFGIDDSGQPNIRGMLNAEIHLVCQRCMQPMTHTVKSRVSLAMVKNDQQAENLPNRYEPLLVGQDSFEAEPGRKDDLSLAELVEDELILALPAIAMHDIDECPAGERFSSKAKGGMQHANHQATTDDDNNTEKPNPFAVLEQLKGKVKTRD